MKKKRNNIDVSHSIMFNPNILIKAPKNKRPLIIQKSRRSHHKYEEREKKFH